MAINYEGLLSVRNGGTWRYSDRETMLYALGIGMGREPMNEKELPFVFEKNLKAIPTMATVMGDTYDDSSLTLHGVNVGMIVHGEERLTLHRPLPAEATITYDQRVREVVDKGKDRGALIISQTDAKLEDGAPLYTLHRIAFARADGGFGGPKEGAPVPQAIPERKPDFVCELDTRPDQALLYRLSGDRNYLHADPATARMAGFDRPVLHGLCSYGTACRAIISTICNYDPTRIRSFDVRFSAPVFGGDTLVTEIWNEGSFLAFRTKVKERDVVVLNNGRCNIS
jgi:acyl dehydratase